MVWQGSYWAGKGRGGSGLILDELIPQALDEGTVRAWRTQGTSVMVCLAWGSQGRLPGRRMLPPCQRLDVIH